MVKILYILAGGALGSLARYSVSGFAQRFYYGIFPIGTLTVNLAGSFIIGFLWSFWEARDLSPNLRSFIFIGLLGGFTTFSSFSLESMNLIKAGETKYALINIFGTNIFGLIFVFLGYMIAKAILN